MRPYIVFDVNETLLDLSALDPHFTAFFGDPLIKDEWFSQVLMSAFSTSILGEYHHFGEVARSSLSMLASKYDIQLSQEGFDCILGQMRELPPHSDVIPALDRIQESGFQMAALTNSPYDVAISQLTNAAIAPYLDVILSVDASRALKPMQKVYIDASRSLGIPPQDLCLIAAHPWDIAGAMHAGWQGIFIERSGKVWNPLFAPVPRTASDLAEILPFLMP